MENNEVPEEHKVLSQTKKKQKEKELKRKERQEKKQAKDLERELKIFEKNSKKKKKPIEEEEEEEEKKGPTEKNLIQRRGRQVNQSFGIIPDRKVAGIHKPAITFMDNDEKTFSVKVDELTKEPIGYERILSIIEQTRCNIGYKNILINKILQSLNQEKIEVKGYNHLFRQIVHANADILYDPAKSSDKEVFIQRWTDAHNYYFGLSSVDQSRMDDVENLQWIRTAYTLVKIFGKRLLESFSLTMLGGGGMEEQIVNKLYGQNRAWITEYEIQPYILDNMLVLDKLEGVPWTPVHMYDYHVSLYPPPFYLGEYVKENIVYTEDNPKPGEFTTPNRYDIQITKKHRRATIHYNGHFLQSIDPPLVDVDQFNINDYNPYIFDEVRQPVDTDEPILNSSEHVPDEIKEIVLEPIDMGIELVEAGLDDRDKTEEAIVEQYNKAINQLTNEASDFYL